MLGKLAQGDLSPIETARNSGTNLKPGTVLVREYKGELHQVTVLAERFSWQGKAYVTLSAVAYAITRANWNGYVFFGLKSKPPKVASHG